MYLSVHFWFKFVYESHLMTSKIKFGSTMINWDSHLNLLWFIDKFKQVFQVHKPSSVDLTWLTHVTRLYGLYEQHIP